jgi:hypothetical protein
MYYCLKSVWESRGRIQDFKFGGGGALKIIAPSGGRRENCWGISCESKCWYYKLCNGYEVIFLRMLCYNVTGVYTNINAKKRLIYITRNMGTNTFSCCKYFTNLFFISQAH